MRLTFLCPVWKAELGLSVAGTPGRLCMLVNLMLETWRLLGDSPWWHHRVVVQRRILTPGPQESETWACRAELAEHPMLC